MSVATAWVKPPLAISGQDPLGTQAPCISIFTDLLPGITNVTFRARYYTFYPWLLWFYERRYMERGTDYLLATLRRAECLFALIGERHGVVRKEHVDLHGAAMVGREVLVPALAELGSGGPLRLSTYATLDEVPSRYFMNGLGGLGQYYFGPLRDSGILGGETRTRQVKFTSERGAPLAEAFDKGNDGEAFFRLLEGDVVRLEDLDALSSFCPCGLKSNVIEQQALVEFFFDRKGAQGEEARPRRMTLGLLLDLIRNGQREDDTPLESEFRASAYTGTFANGSPWALPECMDRLRRAWAVYQRNELLSIAAQTLFWAALQSGIASARTAAADSAAIASLLTTSEAAEALDYAMGETLEYHARRAVTQLPPLGNWADDTHEIQAAWRAVKAAGERDDDMNVALQGAVAVILALVARDGEDDPYAGCSFEAGYFERYPINLRSMLTRARSDWAALSLREAVHRFATWTIETHLRVALQKLSASPPRDTFKVLPFEGHLRVVDAPRPLFTVPRIYRAVVILQDLDLVRSDEDAQPKLTPLGETVLGEVRG